MVGSSILYYFYYSYQGTKYCFEHFGPIAQIIDVALEQLRPEEIIKYLGTRKK